MGCRILTQKIIDNFKEFLIQEEKSMITVDKYIHDVNVFKEYADGLKITKNVVLEYKKELVSKYAVRSVNSKLASLCSLFSFLGWEDCKVKSLRVQKETYSSEEKELSKAEYMRLLNAANCNIRLRLIIETICGTGIRVSELEYFTVEAVKVGTVTVSCKNKTRNIIVPDKLRKLLLNYAKKKALQTELYSELAAVKQ